MKMFSKAFRRIKSINFTFSLLLQIATVVALCILFIRDAKPSSASEQVNYIGNLGKPATVDEITTVKLASAVAQKTDLIVANNVTNLADTIEARDQFVAQASEIPQTPTVLSVNIKTIDDLTTHIVKEGEELSDIAGKYGVKTESIRWSNNLRTDLLAVGKELKIPPVDGVLYTVEEGDTIEGIATTFSGDKQRILVFNDAEADGIKPGQEIMIPGGKKVEVQVSSPAATTSNPGVQIVGGNYTPAYGNYNGYAFGNCTWHAANRRAQVGKPIPNNLGNAATWASLAGQAGFGVSGQPQTHDVLYHKDIWVSGGYGHVAFVEKVNPDGTILVSDMNYYDGRGGGFNRVSTRTIAPSEFGAYLFIR